MSKVVLLAIASCLYASATALAAGTGCLPAPLPSTPVPPVFTVQNAFARYDAWRVPCPNGEPAVLIRVTPMGSDVLLFSSYTVVQGDSQYTVRLTSDDLPNGGGSLFIAKTFFVSPSGPAYDPGEAFSLKIAGTSLDLPAAGPVAPLPTVTVAGSGCAPTCHSNQVVAYGMNFTNNGPPFVAELKGGVRLPDGSILPFVNTVTTIPSGASSMPLVPSQALPANLPAVDVLVEAAILEPNLGVTVSRHSATLHLLP